MPDTLVDPVSPAETPRRPVRHRLVRPAGPDPGLPGSAPALDAAQRRVVAHAGGPLLVLAGPGTGKTTTIVESVVDRVRRRGADPAGILVLTFSRRAAAEVRFRIAARLGRTTREPLAMTFHGYAYAVVRRAALRDGTPVPRLLSGPEHDLEIRRLLLGEAADGGRQWPARLRPALTTRGFAAEVRDLLLRAEERGLDDVALARLGELHGRSDWVAAAGFLRRYEQRFAVDPAGPALDYAQLVRRATEVLTEDAAAEAERAARTCVFVDEYQDTDPAQEDLLRVLAGGGRDLVAVGDPDQSIYAFRGADVGNVLHFPERFRTVHGAPAPVVALGCCRRSGTALLAASRRVAARLPAAGLGARHRELMPAAGLPAGGVDVLVADSPAQEAGYVADALRRAHVLDGVPWSRMAVLVRAARAMPVLRRALVAAGVPTLIAGDEAPLSGEPVVRSLVLLLRCALDPAVLDEDAAIELLTGVLGGADAVQLRRLRRALAEVDTPAAASAAGAEPGRRSPDALAPVLRDPRPAALLAREHRGALDRIVGLLRTAASSAAVGGTAEDVLWAVWSATGLAAEWEAASAAGGPRGAAADRGLDAVLALFDAAARYVDRLPGAGPALFCEEIAQRQIPGDTIAEHAPAGEVVRLLTAHRSKGLEWDVVAVAGVQEGVWPDVRLRGSLLGSERLVDLVAGRAGGRRAAAAAALAEERRLFYVAVTRARRRLIVTAVGGGEQDVDVRPSRFLDDVALGTDVRSGVPPGPLSLPALVAELRAVVTDPARSATLRAAAADRLADLAAAGVPGASPADWQALTAISTTAPVCPPGEPVRISPSQVADVVRCPLRWLLERAAGGGAPPGAAQTVGSVVHALAAVVPDADASPESDLGERLDDAWRQLDLGSPWYTALQRQAAHQQLGKFLAWHRANPRRLVAVERSFDVTAGSVRLRGRVDRLERDEAGRGVVVDLKTGSSKPGTEELATEPQLGAYQLAVACGGFAELGIDTPGGAELVQLGGAALSGSARVQYQPPLVDADDPEWVIRLLDAVGAEARGPSFRVMVNDACRTCPVRTSCPLQPEGARVVP